MLNDEMKSYTGTKTVLAKPMSRAEYNTYRGWELPSDEDGSDAGMLVEYTDGGKSNHPSHSGYISWSPSDVFNRAYSLDGNSTYVELENYINIALDNSKEQLIDRIAELEKERDEIKAREDSKALTVLFGFAGYITSMEKGVIFGASHLATPAVDIAAAIVEANELKGDCDFDWYKAPVNFSIKYAEFIEAHDLEQQAKRVEEVIIP